MYGAADEKRLPLDRRERGPRGARTLLPGRGPAVRRARAGLSRRLPPGVVSLDRWSAPDPELPQAPATPPYRRASKRPNTKPSPTAKLLRIATMVRELLEDTRQASLDEPGRIRLRQVTRRDRRARGRAVARPPGRALLAGAADAGRAHRRRESPRRPGPARRVARGPVPRSQAALFSAADGRSRAVRGVRRRGLPDTEDAGPGTGPVGARTSAQRPVRPPQLPLSWR